MKTTVEIRSWLQEKIADESGEEIQNISPTTRFDHFDLDSLLITSVAFELSEYLGKDIDPTAFSEFPTINELTEWLVSNQ